MNESTTEHKQDLRPASLCRALAEASPMPTAALEGPQHIVSYVNPAFCSLVNQSSEQLVGQSFISIAPAGKEGLALLDRVYRTGRPEIHTRDEQSESPPFYSSYATWPMLTDDNRVIAVLIQMIAPAAAIPQLTAMNEALLVGSVRQHELTEAAEALNVKLQEENQARERAEEELQRANDELNQFVLAASHDLQEPLRMILSFSELLRRGFESHLNQNGLEYLDFIATGARQMRELLTDLLAYARAGGETGEIRKVVDLNLVLVRVLDNLELAIEESGAVVEADALPSITGHQTHFLQLFQNLVGNAIKYRSARRLTIRIQAEKLEDAWRFAVIDNGIGIDPKYHKQVFGVFKRLQRETVPGSGIGLAICQRVIDHYNGRIWIESEADHGATFYFTLPLSEIS